MMPQLDFYILNSQILIILFFVIGYIMYVKYILPVIITAIKFEIVILLTIFRKITKLVVYSVIDLNLLTNSAANRELLVWYHKTCLRSIRSKLIFTI